MAKEEKRKKPMTEVGIRTCPDCGGEAGIYKNSRGALMWRCKKQKNPDCDAYGFGGKGAKKISNPPKEEVPPKEQTEPPAPQPGTEPKPAAKSKSVIERFRDWLDSPAIKIE